MVIWYGKQKLKKYDYYGDCVIGSVNDQFLFYVIVGFGGIYWLSKNLSFGVGVDNLFDKCLFCVGNVQGVVGIDGVGVVIYNEFGWIFYISLIVLF